MRLAFVFPVLLASTVALASSCPQGDEKLQSNTPLSQLCPNGFNSRSQGNLQQAMATHQDNTQMITAAAEQQGVPVALALAVSYHESVGFNSCAGSPTGVKGPMQLTQRTARSYGYDRDINEQNIKGGMAVLKAAYDKCSYDTTCLAKYYNGSTASEQAGWAKGVKNAYNELTNTPELVAAACNGSSGSSNSCMVGPGDLSTSTTTQVAMNTPATSSTDINVATGQV